MNCFKFKIQVLKNLQTYLQEEDTHLQAWEPPLYDLIVDKNLHLYVAF